MTTNDKKPDLLLAKSWDDVKIDPTGWWMSEKLDGIRALWTGSTFLSRGGNEFFAPDYVKKSLPKFMLDGELWLGRQRFQETMSVVRQKTPDARWVKITYKVFDAPCLPGPFEQRKAQINDFLFSAYAEPVGQIRCLSEAHMWDFTRELVKHGAEGIMLRQPGSLYEGKRSKTLIKVKPFKDDEAKCIDIETGLGRNMSKIGGLILQLPSGQTFHVGSGLTDVARAKSVTEYIGKLVTYRYTETTDAGIPKCASFIGVRDYE